MKHISTISDSQMPDKLPFTDTLGERLALVVHLRETEKKTFREIGERVGCGKGRAAQLYNKAKRLQELHEHGEKLDPYYGLSLWVVNCCINLGLQNREQIADAVKSGLLHPQASARCRNFGWKSYKEVHQWLGLPEPVKAVREVVSKVCPHCGGNLS